MVLVPLGGIHLLPGKATAPRPAIATAAPAIPATQAAARLVAPRARRRPPSHWTSAEPPVATSGSLPFAAGLDPPLAAKPANHNRRGQAVRSLHRGHRRTGAATAGRSAGHPPASKSEREAVLAAVATVLNGPATLPSERPSPATRPAAAAREPLPLQTDLINPPPPPVAPEGGGKSGGKPAAADRRG